MARFVAFLRGINVGGRTLKMAELARAFEQAGFAQVETVQQSGNVLFEARGRVHTLTRKIESMLQARFDYPAKVFVRSLEEVAAVLEANPFTHAGPDRHQYVVLMDEAAGRPMAEASKGLDEEVERVRPGQGCVYWTVPKGMTLDSPFAKRLTKAALKPHVTTRNVNTLARIVAKASPRR